MKRKTKRQLIWAAQQKVHAEIAANAAKGGIFAGALSGEGYAGGYRDALSDVMLLMSGVMPNTRNYWTETP